MDGKARDTKRFKQGTRSRGRSGFQKARTHDVYRVIFTYLYLEPLCHARNCR